MSKKPNGYWKIKDNVVAEAAKYSTKTEMKLANQPAYKAMYTMKLSDELFPNGKKSNGYWTREKIMETALKFNSVGEFMKNEPVAYARCCNAGMHYLIESMERQRKKIWSFPDLYIEAGQYNTINEFRYGSSGAYTAARNLGVLEKVASHMNSGYSSTDAVYIWNVKGTSIYKIGVAVLSCVRYRIRAVSKAHCFDVENALAFEIDKPHMYEKKLLKIGSRPKLKRADGHTEFRLLSASDYAEIMEILHSKCKSITEVIV